MTDSLANVVIPHPRFLEYQERRRSVAAALMLPDGPPTIDAVVGLPAAPASRCASNADTDRAAQTKPQRATPRTGWLTTS